MNFVHALSKELSEHWRTHRFLIVTAVFVLLGLGSPVLAKVTPDLLRTIPDMPAGLAEMIPQPTVNDAITQYIKNMSQFGILMALLISMGSIVKERELGTTSLILTRPISRFAFLVSKFTALILVFAAGLALAMIGFWYYTGLLFESIAWLPFLALNGLMLLVFLVYIAVSLLCSAIAPSQGAAAGLVFGALLIIAGIGSIPTIDIYFPGALFQWGFHIVSETSQTSWAALVISILLILVSLGYAWFLLEKQAF